MPGTPIRAVGLASGVLLALCAAAACGNTDRPASAAAARTPAASGSPSGSQTPPTGSPAASQTPSSTLTPSPAGSCSIFPADDVWHSDVSKLPVAARSGTYVASIGASKGLHPDFGAGLIDGEPFGIPVTVLNSTALNSAAAPVRVHFDYADESDPGPYPIPKSALIEGGPASTGDRHVIVFDRSRCYSYELWDATPHQDGTWSAGSGAVFNLRSDQLRPSGWTSADAAGLSVLAGLVQYDEVAAGRIDHAIRITVPRTDDTFVWPARHAAGTANTALPPMGLRLRLKANVDISGLPPQARVIAQALKTYGAIVADNGSPWYLGGTQDSRWDNDQLDALKRFTGADFEAVDTSSLEVSSGSGQAR